MHTTAGAGTWAFCGVLCCPVAGSFDRLTSTGPRTHHRLWPRLPQGHRLLRARRQPLLTRGATGLRAEIQRAVHVMEGFLYRPTSDLASRSAALSFRFALYSAQRFTELSTSWRASLASETDHSQRRRGTCSLLSRSTVGTPGSTRPFVERVSSSSPLLKGVLLLTWKIIKNQKINRGSDGRSKSRGPPRAPRAAVSEP